MPGMSSPIAVVTGASSGIGAASARRLGREGYHVVAAARRAERLEEVAGQIARDGGTATPVRCDVTSDASVAELAAAVADLDAPVTVLVNNAGGAHGLDPIGTARVDDWQWMFDVNVL